MHSTLNQEDKNLPSIYGRFFIFDGNVLAQNINKGII